MLIELGNTAVHNGLDEGPRVTTVHVPEGDGGHTHKTDLDVQTFKDHFTDAMLYRDGIFRDEKVSEVLLAAVNGWGAQSQGSKPSWLEISPGENTPEGHVADLHRFLGEFYGCPVGKPLDVEETHWTQSGPPGVFPAPPDITALFTEVGRNQQALNYGGGQVGATGTGTAATATTFTTASTLVTNAWAGYRLYVWDATVKTMVWGNVISNTNAASASVVTVDRWYAPATPGGAAAAEPKSGYNWMLADGGNVSSWFVGLSTASGYTPALGNVKIETEYTTAGGFVRKISPFAHTAGTTTFTLIPVYTANSEDVSHLPLVFYAIGAYSSMVTSNETQALKFATKLNASATIAAEGDVLTATETITTS
jgi:hypothetical protein